MIDIWYVIHDSNLSLVIQKLKGLCWNLVFFNSLLFLDLRCYFPGILSHVKICYGSIFCIILLHHNLKSYPVFFACEALQCLYVFSCHL